MPGRGVRSAVLPGTPSQQRSAELLIAVCPAIDTQTHKNIRTFTNEDLNTELSHYISMEEMSLPNI